MTLIMDLNTVALLLKVAELRSFTAAAASTGLTQSGLSRAIRRLEEQLGVKLLHRNTRSVSLTADGLLLRERCAPLLAGFEEAEQLLLDRRCEPSGTLRLSLPSAFGRIVILPLLGELTQRHPELVLDATMTDRLVDLAEEGFDAAVRIGPLSDVRLVARPLAPMHWVTVASPGYLDRHGVPQTLEDLARHNCLVVHNPYLGRRVDWQFVQHGRLVDVPVSGQMLFDVGDPLIDAALQGFGIVQVMDFVARQALADGRLVPVLEPFAGRWRELALVYPPSRQHSPRLKVFSDLLQERWPSAWS